MEIPHVTVHIFLALRDQFWEYNLVWYPRINGVQTVQLDGAHLDQTLARYLNPAPHCWVSSPWKPSCGQGWCRKLVFVRKLGAWRLVFCCCFLKSAGLWKGLFVADLHFKAPLRPVFSTTQWNKHPRQLNLKKLPCARPHIFGEHFLFACQSVLIDTLHIPPYNVSLHFWFFFLTNCCRDSL